jgi:hypothetical protein
MMRVKWVILALAMFGCTSDGSLHVLQLPLVVDTTALAPIGGGNALTLPAQRHVVRLSPSGTPHWLLAVQQDGADNHGLGFFRSDDDGRSFNYYKPIQNDASERDTADLLAVGNDLAVVYSFEGPTLTGSPRHDVVFQWWRYASGEWSPEPAVVVFDATTSTTAYYRAEIARDSLGRLWVQAFFRNSDGSAIARIAVSTDGGATFQIQPDLGTFPTVGGGRLLSLGTRLVFVWDGEDATSPARFRTRDDSAPLSTWSPPTLAFNEGIYHGAALSAVADGGGGMHFVYKDKNAVLWYRKFDGSAFGAAQQIESQGQWELQPATTLVGSDLWIFYNRVIVTSMDDELRIRRLSADVLQAPAVIDSSVSFKGYPAAVDVLPAGTASLPGFWGVTPTANDAGQLQLYSVAIGGGPTPDLSVGLDMASPADLSQSSGLLFSDAFNRQIPPDGGLGVDWSIGAGLWFTDGRADSDLDGTNLAAENVVQCRDCTVTASVITFGTEGGVYLRAPTPTSSDRYDLVLLPNAHVQIRRVLGGSVTVLGDVASGVADLGTAVTLSLQATGSSPVTLVGRVNGATRLTAVDSGAVLAGAGSAGLWTTNAGVVFDNFELTSASMSVPDMGLTRDLSAPADLAAPRDLSAPPDLAGGGTGGTLFTDAFSRSIPPDDGLGASWSIGAGLWFTDGRANSDQDGNDLTAENVIQCRDCTVQASVITFGSEGGVYVRAPSPTSPDRYDLVSLPNAHVQIRRVRSGTVTVLGDAPSGLASLDGSQVLALSAVGDSPVVLVGKVNGTTQVTASDFSPSALGAGYAGLWTPFAGVVFDDFSLTGVAASGGGGGPDLGTADGGVAISCPFGASPLPGGGCGLADLQIDQTKLSNSVYTDVRTFAPNDCEVVEGCVVAGTRQLLEFGILTWNRGQHDLLLGDPTLDPAHFVFQACHNHYHLKGYAQLRVLDGTGQVVASGKKESFCIADSNPPPGGGTQFYHCAFQGLSVGWGDEYGAGTSCQYIDVTGVPPGSYILEVTLNPDRIIAESDYTNNVGRVEITLP